MFIDFRERGKGREREREREKHRLVASHTPADQASNPQPRYVPCPGMERATFWCMGQCSNQLSHPARTSKQFFSEFYHTCKNIWYTNSKATAWLVITVNIPL